MELELDKEIDALMRSGMSGSLADEATQTAHPDADELAAFAENATPERVRSVYVRHLADCSRCRKILSGLITLNTEAEPSAAVAAASAAPATTGGSTPWYRRLPIFPNLAYVMGALVLVFGGLLTYNALQNSHSETSVAQTTGSEQQLDQPVLQSSADSSANANVSSNAANTNEHTFDVSNQAAAKQMASAASNTAVASSPLGVGSSLAERKADVPKVQITLDRDEKAAAPVAAPPPPLVNNETKNAGQVFAQRAPETRREKDKELSVNGSTADLSSRQADSVPKAKSEDSLGKMRSMRSEAGPAENSVRRVDGVEFRLKDGVWYDSRYRGQATTNVRRGTDEFGRLDKGVKSIAQKLTGTVVVVWKTNAYRID